MASSPSPEERSGARGSGVALGARSEARRGRGRSSFLAGDPARSSSWDGPGRIRVVVVDDNEGFRESLVALLTAAGHEVAGEAGDGRGALEGVGTPPPGVGLMDIPIPALD